MNNKEIYEQLKNIIPKDNIKQNEPMSKHTTFKIGGPADFYIKVYNIDELKKILEFTNNNNIPLIILGNGSNILVKDSGISGIVLKLEMKQVEINHLENGKEEVKVQSGVPMGYLAQILLKNEISGFENLSGIPGTVGGAVLMNAGCYGKEMKDIVSEVVTMDYNGNIHKFSNKESNFKYRKSKFSDGKYIILGASLILESGKKEDIQNKMNEYLKNRKDKQPIEFPSAGSTFKRGTNFITAALIDQAGLKEYVIGGAQVSGKHAGFIINNNDATAQDVLDLVKYVQEKVYEKFGKKIELEIKVLGK